MKRFALVTFGCQMNVHDSQRMEEILQRDGYTSVADTADADVIVMNTCSVREKAEQKLRSEAGRLKHLNAFLVVTGCVAQQEGKALQKSLPFIDAVVGPDNLAELPEILRLLEQGAPPVVRTVFDTDAPEFLASLPVPGRVGASAYVTTMKGCNERCSFCIVPYTRGPERYRPAEQIVSEVRAMVSAGVREVVLLGQTVNSYRDPGVPMPVDADPDDSQFAVLLNRIAREVPDLVRLRYTSPHPRHVTADLIRAHASLDVLAEHVHLPVQSGSDRVLKRMIRRYTRAEYVTRARALLGARAAMALTTDVIVGFPGETREDFAETLSLVREVGFAGLFGFKYSQRPRTPALKLRDDVSEAEKQVRLLELFEISEAMLRVHLSALVGTRQAVLIEGPGRSDPMQLVGRTHRNEIVHVPWTKDASAGALATVEILRAHKHSLEGRIESVARPAAGHDARAQPMPSFRRVVLPVVNAG